MTKSSQDSARLKCTSDDWVEPPHGTFPRPAHHGATMMFGCGGNAAAPRESSRPDFRQYVKPVASPRSSPGFSACGNPALGKKFRNHIRRLSEDPPAFAVSRFCLSTTSITSVELAHGRVSGFVQGLGIWRRRRRQHPMIEENWVFAAGFRNRTTEDDSFAHHHDAGFRPRSGDTLYRSTSP